MRAVPNDMAARRHELLLDLVSTVSELGRDHGLRADVADQLGHELADRLAERWGGQNFMFPSDYHFRLARRDREILDAWRGGATTHALAAKYGMAERSIRRLMRRAAARAAV